MKPLISRPELVAPAGNLNKLKTALAFGADAVYFGLPDFSLRSRVNDFDESSLEEGVRFAHNLGRKVYATINIFAKNKHFGKLPDHVLFLKRIGVDGVFVSDPGVADIVKKEWPSVRLILSTQANCTNYASAAFWLRYGFSRIVLARELTFNEIKEIKRMVPEVELECFVHGALCMSYSGRCLLSSYYSGRESNLGDCSQPCRWKFYLSSTCNDNGGSKEELELIEDCNGSYIFNSKDLCLIKKIPQMVEIGIDAFKIEGRAKSVYYLANIVGAYRKVIDKFLSLREQIGSQEAGNQIGSLCIEIEDILSERIFNRGYTQGFMFESDFSKENNECSHKKIDWEFCGQLKESVKNGDDFRSYFFVHNTVRIGDEIEIVEPPYEVSIINVNKIFDHNDNEISEAHGGSGEVVYITTSKKMKEYSIIRRKIKDKSS